MSLNMPHAGVPLNEEVLPLPHSSVLPALDQRMLAMLPEAVQIRMQACCWVSVHNWLMLADVHGAQACPWRAECCRCHRAA